jgi:hypothetical protein
MFTIKVCQKSESKVPFSSAFMNCVLPIKVMKV